MVERCDLSDPDGTVSLIDAIRIKLAGGRVIRQLLERWNWPRRDLDVDTSQLLDEGGGLDHGVAGYRFPRSLSVC